MKIFLTVGHQMPFDRLTSAIDEWYVDNPSDEVYGQVGETQIADLHFEHVPSMPPLEFRERIQWADLVVSHAGMGTIISSLDLATPLLVLPRKASNNETRNDHQFGTTKRLTDLGLVRSVPEIDSLPAEIAAIRSSPQLGKVATLPSDRLVRTLSAFINEKRA